MLCFQKDGETSRSSSSDLQDKKGRPNRAAFSMFDGGKLNAWRTGSSYALLLYRISYAQQRGCHV